MLKIVLVSAALLLLTSTIMAAAAVGGAQPSVLGTQELPKNLALIDLKIEGVGPRTRAFYKAGNGEFTQVGRDLEPSFLSTDTAGGFQGVTLGMFAHI
jgi:beta-xylosidase